MSHYRQNERTTASAAIFGARWRLMCKPEALAALSIALCRCGLSQMDGTMPDE